MIRATCLIATAFAISACSQSDAVTSVNGPPVTDAARGPAANVFTRVDLGTLGGASSYAAAINSSGIVVGWSDTKAGDTHAFRWTPTTGMVDLGTLPGAQASQAVAILDGSLTDDPQILGISGGDAVVWSQAASISVLPISPTTVAGFAHPQGFNERGQVVGFDAGGGQHAWIWSARDGKSDLSSTGQEAGNEASASAITSEGVALLTTHAATCTRNPQCWRSYLWSTASGFRPLGVPDGNSEASVNALAINENQTVVGWREVSGDVAPYRWTSVAGFTVLPNYSLATYAYAAGVNASETTVGAALEPTSGSIVATLWPATGGILRLSPDDPNPSVALAVNRGGTVAGWASVAGGVNHAVIWVPSSQPTRQQTAGAIVSNDASSHSSHMDVRSSATNACLKQMHSLGSREALFGCVMQADRAQRSRSK